LYDISLNDLEDGTDVLESLPVDFILVTNRSLLPPLFSRGEEFFYVEGFFGEAVEILVGYFGRLGVALFRFLGAKFLAQFLMFGKLIFFFSIISERISSMR